MSFFILLWKVVCSKMRIRILLSSVCGENFGASAVNRVAANPPEGDLQTKTRKRKCGRCHPTVCDQIWAQRCHSQPDSVALTPVFMPDQQKFPRECRRCSSQQRNSAAGGWKRGVSDTVSNPGWMVQRGGIYWSVFVDFQLLATILSWALR